MNGSHLLLLSIAILADLVQAFLQNKAGRSLSPRPRYGDNTTEAATKLKKLLKYVKDDKQAEMNNTESRLGYQHLDQLRRFIKDHKPAKDDKIAQQGYQHSILQYATSMAIETFLGNQSVRLMPDTGSFDVLVSSVLCTKCKSKKYRVTESSDFSLEVPTKEHTFHFGSGDVQAVQAYDRFDAGPFTVPKMPLWLISSISPSLYEAFGSTEFDGLLGLGLDRSSAAEQMRVTSFSLCLQPFVSSWFSGGTLRWNGRDEHSFEWSPSVTSMDSFHWQVQAEGVKLGTSHVGAGSIVFDTGTSILAAPKDSAYHLEKALPEVPANCSLEGIPSLTMKLTDGQLLTLSPSAYVIKLGGNTDVFDTMAKEGTIVWRKPKTDESKCAPMFQITQSGHWILGMPFFREYAVHFDRIQMSMSFAKNKGGTCGPGSSFALRKPDVNHVGVVEVDSSVLAKALERRL